ncbi:MAG: aminopeptidase [Clostridiales bacterium]|jgi:aminopeptidase|nr:aminopeptidase [Clostridiales bacterium]
MKDERYTKLAGNLIRYSVRLAPGENVLIEAMSGQEAALATELIRAAYLAGGQPHIQFHNQEARRALLSGLTVPHAELMAAQDLVRMKNMQAYIGLRGSDNVYEDGDVPDERSAIYQKHYSKPVHSEQRVRHTKWCVLRYPTASMAQLAHMSTEAFEDFYFDVCNLDYQRMSDAMDPLVALIDRTERVRLTGPGTDLRFSIKGLPAVKCDGHRNIPDGEVYTAPVRDSVNGVISYNAPSVYQGTHFSDVVLEFRDGKIIRAEANETEQLNKILDIDEGARYVGEFSFGLNPYILAPMNDTLFDEKISGSIHFTPGSTYDACDNGNRSAIHWDLVLIQRPEYGGGEIYFDDKLIRKDGRFVPPELACLNPENLR